MTPPNRAVTIYDGPPEAAFTEKPGTRPGFLLRADNQFFSTAAMASAT